MEGYHERNHGKEASCCMWGLESQSASIKTGKEKVPETPLCFLCGKFYEDSLNLDILVFVLGGSQQNQKRAKSRALAESLLLQSPSGTA